MMQFPMVITSIESSPDWDDSDTLLIVPVECKAEGDNVSAKFMVFDQADIPEVGDRCLLTLQEYPPSARRSMSALLGYDVLHVTKIELADPFSYVLSSRIGYDYDPCSTDVQLRGEYPLRLGQEFYLRVAHESEPCADEDFRRIASQAK